MKRGCQRLWHEMTEARGSKFDFAAIKSGDEEETAKLYLSFKGTLTRRAKQHLLKKDAVEAEGHVNQAFMGIVQAIRDGKYNVENYGHFYALVSTALFNVVHNEKRKVAISLKHQNAAARQFSSRSPSLPMGMDELDWLESCLLYTSPSPRDRG